MDDIEDKHWFWDTECFIRRYKRGYEVVEFPVIWRHSGATKVNAFKDAKEMSIKLIKLWWKMKDKKVKYKEN